jgi:hypothetical protein
VRDFISQLRARIALILAVALSTIWVVAVGAYVRAHGGFAGLQQLAPLDLVSLVAATAAPLAVLWLIVALMEQRRAVELFARRLGEFAQQNRQSLQQAETQARTLLQLQAQGTRAQLMETRQLALQDMAASVAVLAERLGVMDREAAAAAWMRYGAGDVNVFVQAFLNFAVSHPDIAARMAEAVARDAVAGTALATFVRRYERLLALSGDDKLAAEIFDDGALGRAYRLFKSADAQAAQMQAVPGDAAAQTHEVVSDSEFAQHRLANLGDRLEAAAPQ